MRRRKLASLLLAALIAVASASLTGCGSTRSYWGVESGWDDNGYYAPNAYWGVQGDSHGGHYKKHKKHKKSKKYKKHNRDRNHGRHD